MNLGTTVTMTSNGREAAEGQRQPSHAAGQSDQQATGHAPPLQPNGTNQQGPGGPRVIRITHQTMEPVVMMQMNLDGTYVVIGPALQRSLDAPPSISVKLISALVVFTR